MPELLQHILATGLALGAAVFVARRVFHTVQPGPASPKCAGCPSAKDRVQALPAETTIPLALVKR